MNDVVRTTIRPGEYRALALMYFGQGLPAGLAFMALGPLLRDAGHSVAEVGTAGMAAFLPWALKFLWAGPIDNACMRWGHARVVFALQGSIVAVAATLVPLAPTTHFGALLIATAALNLLSATQDIATNAYAVGRMQGRAAGPANAIQIVAFIAGMLSGGSGLLIAHARYGWSTSASLLTAALALLGFGLLLERHWRSPRTGAAPYPAPAPRIRLRDLRQHRDLGWALLVALTFKFGGTAVSTLMQPWLVDRGMALMSIGRLQAAMLIGNAVGGVLLGIPLVRRLGSRGAVRVAVLLAGLALGTAWALERAGVGPGAPYYAALVMQSLFEGAMYVTIWALFMNWSSPQRPGTDYTAMQCCESLTNALAAGAIGGLGQQLGYAGGFALAWLGGLLAAALIVLALPRLRLQAEPGTALTDRATPFDEREPLERGMK